MTPLAQSKRLQIVALYWCCNSASIQKLTHPWAERLPGLLSLKMLALDQSINLYFLSLDSSGESTDINWENSENAKLE